MIITLDKIKKKNGTIVPFQEENIRKAVERSISETSDPTAPEYTGAPDTITQMVVENLLQLEDEIPTVEQVHRFVENSMMELKLFDAVRTYLNYKEKHRPDIFRKRVAIKPYEYPELLSYIDAIRHSYWVHTEFNYSPDIQDMKINLSPEERQIVERAMLAISQIESAVKEFWGKIGNKLQKPEIKKVGATFSESEVRHEDAYSNLIEILGLNHMFEKLKLVPALNERIKYLELVNQNNNATENKDFFESIILFSMFIENVSLFSQFLIIMSYNKHGNMLKGMSNAVEATSKEENIHAMFGFDLVNIIKKENPDWWTPELIEYIYEITRRARVSELDVVEWIYDGGDSEYAKKEQTIAYLDKRFNDSLVAIGLEPIFEVNEDLLQKTLWFDEEIEMNKDLDFFVKRSVAYQKRTKSVTVDDLF